MGRVPHTRGCVWGFFPVPPPRSLFICECEIVQGSLAAPSILKDSGMTQVQIAKILGVRQPQISLLMRNRAGNFSIGRLVEFLTPLRQDVEITVRPTPKELGALSVISA